MALSGFRSEALSCWIGHFAPDDDEAFGCVGGLSMFCAAGLLCIGHDAGGRFDGADEEDEEDAEGMAGWSGGSIGSSVEDEAEPMFQRMTKRVEEAVEVVDVTGGERDERGQ